MQLSLVTKQPRGIVVSDPRALSAFPSGSMQYGIFSTGGPIGSPLSVFSGELIMSPQGFLCNIVGESLTYVYKSVGTSLGLEGGISTVGVWTWHPPPATASPLIAGFVPALNETMGK